jgi:hypothetical protein
MLPENSAALREVRPRSIRHGLRKNRDLRRARVNSEQSKPQQTAKAKDSLILIPAVAGACNRQIDLVGGTEAINGLKDQLQRE